MGRCPTKGVAHDDSIDILGEGVRQNLVQRLTHHHVGVDHTVGRMSEGCLGQRFNPSLLLVEGDIHRRR